MGRCLDKAKSASLLDGTAALKIPANYVDEDSAPCPHAAGCPHPADYLIEEFERTGKLRVEFEGSAVYLVQTREIAETVTDGTVYRLSEWIKISGLSVDEIRLMHRLRTIGGPGGSIELKEAE